MLTGVIKGLVNQRVITNDAVVEQFNKYPDHKVIYVLPYSSKLLLRNVKNAVETLNLPWEKGILKHIGYGELSDSPVIFLSKGSYVSAETNPQHPQLLADLNYLFPQRDKILFVLVYPQWGTDVVAKISVDAKSSAFTKWWKNFRNFTKLRKFVYTHFYETYTYNELIESALGFVANLPTLPLKQSSELELLYKAVQTNQFQEEEKEELIKLLATFNRDLYQVILRRRNSNQAHLTRKQTMQRVIDSEAVQDAILTVSRKSGKEQVSASALKEQNTKATEIINEIAADLDFKMLKKYDYVLSRLWNRVYSGIQVRGLDRLQRTLFDNEKTNLVYASTHRSHFDYLLLSYILNEWGAIKTPHIAAGVNLNFFPVGWVFRKGGAFFIRRSFKNYLYAVIFKSYIAELIHQEQDIEYFIEGGRSRTGRLLTPKTGVLNMTIDGFLKNPDANMFYVPIFIAYDKVFESSTYVSELQGKKKAKESSLLVIKNLRKVKYQGHVYVNFAKPLFIASYFDKIYPNWVKDLENNTVDKSLVDKVSEAISRDTMNSINANATITGQALISAVLYNTKGKILKTELAERIDFLRDILNKTKLYNPEFEIIDDDANQIIDKILLIIKKHVVKNDGRQIEIRKNYLSELNYYRNNIEHAFIAPSLAAIMHLNKLTKDDLEVFVKYFAEIFNAASFTSFSCLDLYKSVEYFYKVLETASELQLDLLAKQLLVFTHQADALLKTIRELVQEMIEKEQTSENLALSKVVGDSLAILKQAKNPYPDYADKGTVNHLRLAFESAGTINFANLEDIKLAQENLRKWIVHPVAGVQGEKADKAEKVHFINAEKPVSKTEKPAPQTQDSDDEDEE